MVRIIGIPPPHAGFEPNIAPEGAGRFEDFASVPRQQRFVGGNDMLPLLQRRQQIGTGRFIAPDQLHHNGNLRVVQHLQSVTRELGWRELHSTFSVRMFHGDAF